jgi:tetratricopeptide (TPR) repeat protein
MKKLFFLILFCLYFTQCFALDWKSLHEQADAKGMQYVMLFLENNPDSIEGLYALGLVYLNNHKNKDAEEIFKKIIAIEPASLEARWGIAEVLRREHKLEESLSMLNDILKEKPDFAPACISMAYIKYLRMDFNVSVGLAQRVLALGRDNVDLTNYVRAYAMLAGAKGMIAHYGGPISKVINGTKVLPNLRRAERLQPEAPAVLFGLGSFYLLAPSLAGGDLAKAEQYLRKSISVDSLFADAYVRLAQVYKLKGQMDVFNSLLEDALKIDQGNELAMDIKNGSCRYICVGN